MAGASIETTLELWASSLREVKGRMRPLFAQDRAAVSAGLFLDGLLSDERRNTSAFQDHIAGRGPARTDRDHSSAGAVYARNRLGHAIGRIVAHIVAGHHAGLKDKLLGDEERLDRRKASLGPVVRTAKADGFALPEALPADLEAAVARKTGFALALLTRMLFSCLVDADRTESRTAEAEAKGEATEPEFTATPADLAADLRRTTAEQDAARREDGTAADPVNRLRTRVRTTWQRKRSCRPASSR